MRLIWLRMLLGSPWFLRLVAGGPALGAALAFWVISVSTPSMKMWDRLWIFASAPVAALAAFLVMLIVMAIVCAPICSLLERLGGGPFKVGDTVRVVTGRYRGVVARVYSTWQGGALRVDLNEQAKESYADIFAGYQLLRAEAGPGLDA